MAVTATAADNVAVASVQFKLDGNNLGSPVTSAPYQINWNTTTATNASHSLTAVATDTSNNTGSSTAVTVTVSNAGGGPSGILTDTLVSDFSAGTGTNTYVSQIGDGEVIQLPTVGTEFSGTTLPSGWTVNNWSSGGSASVSGGKITVDGARVGTAGTYTAGRSLDFVATFTTDGAQHVGFGVDFNSSPWAIFSTRGGGSLLARSNSGSGGQDTVISGNWLGAPHHYRIDWNAANVVYWIDGVQVVTHPLSDLPRHASFDQRLAGRRAKAGRGLDAHEFLQHAGYVHFASVGCRSGGAMGHDVVDGGSASWYNSGHEREVREYGGAGRYLDCIYVCIAIRCRTNSQFTLHPVSGHDVNIRYRPDCGSSGCHRCLLIRS